MAVSSVLTIGTFDGVHRGHQAIVARCREIARPHGAKVVAMAFDPHPATMLRPDAAPPRLTGPAVKRDRLEQAGADQVVLMPPTRDLLGQEPEAFIGRLVREYQPIAFVEGADFHFGRARRGNMTLLREMGKREGFDVIEAPTCEATLSDLTLMPVRSSLLRRLIGLGRVHDVALCLGRAFELTARVVAGDQRGRAIGVPTANLDAGQLAEFMIPADGVYAGRAQVDGHHRPAAISIGSKPTFGGHELTIEAHLLDFDADLYDAPLTLRFDRWLRDQRPFPNVDTLRNQIRRDIDQTRRAFQSQSHTAA